MPSDYDPRTESSSDGRPARRLGAWQKLLAIVSLVLTIGGGGLWAVAAMKGDAPVPAAAATGGDPSVLQNFMGEGPGGDGAPTAAATDPTFLDEWSPTIFKLGFSFFAAFCVAYALRSFVKIALIAIGLLLIALFGLQYFGLVEVDWTEWSSRYDSVAAWLGEQTKTFKTFIQGALPSSASAAVGFIAGFRRRG